MASFGICKTRATLVSAALAALAVFCAGASASPAKPANNLPRDLRAFSQVRLTVDAPSQVVARSAATFTVRLNNPTGRTFHNVRLVLAGLLSQSNGKLAKTSSLPYGTSLGNIHQGDTYNYSVVAKLRPGASKPFLFYFDIGKEKQSVKMMCLHITAIVVSANGRTSKPVRSADCAAYRR